MARIFEPYVTTKPRGTGLGLAIVKKIVDEHHGSVAIENRPTPRRIGQRAAAAGEGGIDMAQILVVDDEVGIRELLSEILADEGHRCMLAESAGDARRLRERGRARPRAARHLDARYRRHHAAQGMGGERPAHHAGGDDVGPRHDRDRGRGDAHRRARLPGEADRAAAAARHREARAAQPRGGRGAAARARRARPLAGARGCEEAPGAARAGRPRRSCCAASAACGRSCSRGCSPRRARPSSPARSCSPSRLPSCSPRRPAESCSSPTSRGWRAPSSATSSSCWRAPRSTRCGWCRFRRSTCASLAEKHDFDPDLAARLSELTLRLPALREFAEDVPDLASLMLAQMVEARACPAAATCDRRAQRAAPPRLARQPGRAGERGEGPRA